MFTDALRAILRSRLGGAGHNYDLTKPWVMMQDLSQVTNSAESIGYLVIPAFRTHGTGLGDAVTKKVLSGLPPGTTPTCPWCLRHATDDTCHATTACGHPDSMRIRQREAAPLVEFMRTREPLWHRKYIGSVGDKRLRCRLLLTAATAASPAHAPEAMVLLTSLLCEIRKAHPTYKQYFKHAPLESLDYYVV